jgi:hypothetical protein
MVEVAKLLHYVVVPVSQKKLAVPVQQYKSLMFFIADLV